MSYGFGVPEKTNKSATARLVLMADSLEAMAQPGLSDQARDCHTGIASAQVSLASDGPSNYD